MTSRPTPAPRRLTSGALTTGVVVSAACFLIAGAGELAGFDSGPGDMTDVAALFDGLITLRPWAWASLGTLVVVTTPAFGLVATAFEYASVSDRRTVFLALAVLAVLGVSVLLALVR